jgi:Arc/MetJ-type ribon-helix-helix transcriptional regulator
LVSKAARKHTTITIPTTLFELLQDRIKTTGFGSVSAYATYVLRETLTESIEEDVRKGRHKRDQDAILERLRQLGYIVHHPTE